MTTITREREGVIAVQVEPEFKGRSRITLVIEDTPEQEDQPEYVEAPQRELLSSIGDRDRVVHRIRPQVRDYVRAHSGAAFAEVLGREVDDVGWASHKFDEFSQTTKNSQTQWQDFLAYTRDLLHSELRESGSHLPRETIIDASYLLTAKVYPEIAGLALR